MSTIYFDTKSGTKYYHVIHVSEPSKIVFQAMAVAPKSKNGAVDMKRITTAYAGTNVKSIGDVATDGTNVFVDVDATGQCNDVKRFADEIHTKYPNAKIRVTDIA